MQYEVQCSIQFALFACLTLTFVCLLHSFVRFISLSCPELHWSCSSNSKLYGISKVAADGVYRGESYRKELPATNNIIIQLFLTELFFKTNTYVDMRSLLHEQKQVGLHVSADNSSWSGHYAQGRLLHFAPGSVKLLTHLSSQRLLKSATLASEMDFWDFSFYFGTVASNIRGRQVLYKAAKTPTLSAWLSSWRRRCAVAIFWRASLTILGTIE